MPSYSVDRSISIEATPEKVFDVVADYRTWTSWSPWLCSEPDAKVTVSEDPCSVGAKYCWEGDIVGSGELEHIELSRGQSIRDEIRFFKPFKSKSNVSFQILPSGDETNLTWSMNGSLPWFMFWMKPMMTSMISMDYERGLRMLKEWIETGRIESKTEIKGLQAIDTFSVSGIRKQSSMKDISSAMEVAYSETNNEFDRLGVPRDKGCVSVYHHFDLKRQILDFTTGYVVDEALDSTALNDWSIDECSALRVDHTGRYEHLGNAWSAANQFARYKKLKQSKVGTFEIYRNMACDVEASELKTEIYLPLR
ncbi:MAG: SRPBCC family protein [Planctomycetota bacterium]